MTNGVPYFISSLKPDCNKQKKNDILDSLCDLTWVQWAQFFSGWLAWTCDALDFFCVSLTITDLEAQFNRPAYDITTAITLTLLFRSLGAFIFGIVSDRFGRKWPLAINLVLCSTFQLCSGFVQTFHQFLAVRSLFGIAMGGIWGLAAAMALENLPVKLRGLGSGVIQISYSLGCIIAAVISLTLIPETTTGWKSLFWCASGMSLFAATIAALVPDSAVFLRVKEIEKERGMTTMNKTRVFLRQTKMMLGKHWMLCIYSVVLMAGFNFLSHGSQDLYPTYLQSTKNLSAHDAIVATIIGHCGAVIGGSLSGLISQYIGRRLTIVLSMFLVGAFIPLWILPSRLGPLAAGFFCMQLGVGGAWGVIPIHLAEMSPPAFRATFPGVSYQVGNMLSSASAQLVTVGGDNLKTYIEVNGRKVQVPDYPTVLGIFIGVVSTFVLFITIIGHENHSAHFEKAKLAFEEGGGNDEFEMDDTPTGQEETLNDEVKGNMKFLSMSSIRTIPTMLDP